MTSESWSVAFAGLAFAEGLRWHRDALYLSDVFDRAVLRWQDGAPQIVTRVAGRPLGLGWRPDGAMLVASISDRAIVAVTDAGTEIVADLAPLVGGDLNDMVVDAAGRAYVGNFGYDYVGGAPRRPANLVLVDVDGAARVVADGLGFPNGMVITPDGRDLLVAETSNHCITAFTIGSDGSLADRRVFAALGPHRPDGITLDAEQAVWLASPATREIVRVAEGGRVLATLRLPHRETPQTCVLGGADGRSLFVATAPSHDEQECLAQRAGQVLMTRVTVPAASTGKEAGCISP